MSTLFNNDNSLGGYRLRYMEVFNWGTFDGKVYKLKTNSSTSLLTGANGSGKTTLIDALLTILVPSQKRFYNQSSGAEFKKERDENSYFWGFYGKSYSELEEKSKTEQLRTKADNPYSVLLACFQNADTQHTITLVQVRWYSNSGLQKVYIVAPYQLEINKHFGAGRFDHRGEWKKKLQREFPKTDFFNSFKEYAARFSDLFGLKEKALSLFNQTVGIKVLGDLTPFIRQHMLEEQGAEEQFKSLHDHYVDLLISHKAIRKDELQLQLLQPIIQNNDELTERRKTRSELETIEDQLQFYLGRAEYDLIEDFLSNIESEISEKENNKKRIENSLKGLERDKEQLIIQRAKYNIDHQVSLLNKDIDAETEKRNSKHALCTRYTNLLKNLDLSLHLSEKVFRENVEHLKVLHSQSSIEQEQLSETKIRLKIQAEGLSDKINNTQAQIAELQKRRNKIPDDLVAARKRLANLLEASEEELPFVGELIRVLPEESDWQDSIERLLHGFAMQLLIPEKYCKQANQFIHINDMRTKLVYHKIERKPTNSIARWPKDNEALVNKLEIKETFYKEWLEVYLLDRFNYYCTDDLEIFWGSQRAITSNGLIRNSNRHEKDDRPDRWNRSKYRLGWDNKETIYYLLQEKQKMETEHGKMLVELRELEPTIKDLKAKLETISALSELKHFDEINWQQHVEKIATYNKQIVELKTSSDAYQTIISQIDSVTEAIEKKNNEHQAVVKELGKLEKEFNDKNKQKLEIELNDLSDDTKCLIESFLKKESLDIADVNNLQALVDFRKELFLKLKSKKDGVVKALSKLELQTTELIAAFIHPGEKISSEFADWGGDVLNISPNIDGLEDLAILHDLIRNQRLVEHKRRFKDYMDRSMLDSLTNYRTWLNNEEDKIKEIIDELNEPLKKIVFNKNPDTYLQLECKGSKEQDIKIFREQLNLAIPNIIEFAKNEDDVYREQVFEKIKNLITELQKEEVWRKKVTDVRNWLSFSAREYTKVDNKAIRYHDSTASYSGGQKAQFTYAILGAAIAHQFGIFQPGKQHRSLRFITVDEAFSKLDPRKSEFLMEFCAQLNLQLLIVTPLDKINIAEPYINAVHYVEIKNQRNSVLYNLTMEEYQEKKEAFNQLAGIAG